MTEQRNYRRINFKTEADISIDNDVFRCDLVDLALQGALFRSERELPLSLGKQVPVNIFLPDTSVRMKFVGELIHQNGNFYGFIFTSEDAESMGHLRRLLELNFGDSEQAEGEFSHWLKRGSAD
ncbi:MAG: PilZ domain-containing protein [Thermodesulfobacteriota bacterium]|nr:PilZ domain-containing protein [Thermodesulfobacteriota bacterium]